MKRKLLLCAALLWSAAAFAVPTSAQVEAAVKAGNYSAAETMMQEVVTDKPQSAKAHYVYAEILAHDAKFGEAAAQARRAREIDPKIGFTDPDKFRSFEQTLQREQAGATAQTAPARVAPYTPAAAPPAVGGGVPGWVWGAGFAVVAFLIFRAVSRRAASAPLAPAGAYPAQAGGYGAQPGYGQPGYGQPGYGQPGYGPAPGGGLLRTGLAAAGGVAAGMLVEKMLEGDHRGDGLSGGGVQGNGFDNGSAQAASELETRQIDFGSGNDWGGDAGSSGSDFTPSGDDNGGGW